MDQTTDLSTKQSAGGTAKRQVAVEADGYPADAILTERVRAGNHEAFGTLYDRHATTVYSIAMNILKDPSRAEDVTQDVFITYWNKPERYNPTVGKFAPWFYRVARNRSIDILRRQRREMIPDDSQVFEATLHDTEPNPSDLVVTKTEANRVRAAVTELPEVQRELIELAYFSGMTQSEMASHLDLPLGTVKTRVRNGLGRLRDILREDAG